ncbi:dihydrodipicolinate synthase family protein [Occultella kanbiaonis]|uniref:dihydrodipicolinate synthase family protein n=1 Tax=Occultella kanbiaonis TaxID=2675754 RepID=UPI001B3574EC|nr:dihydrodipicolinate synthase family protein [Occultella kanbiaonis]
MAMPMSASELRGVWGTVLLPLDPGDRIDLGRLRAEVDVLTRSDLHGVYAHGTAGEFHTLTDAEYDQVNDLLATASSAVGKPFQLGASHPLAHASLERVRRARDLEPAAIQVILPDWIPLSEAEVLRFLDRMAQVAAPVPLVLYSPPHAKTQVSPELLARIVTEMPAVIGIKTLDRDDDWFARMRELEDRCALFVPGHRLASALARGAHGSYSNVAALSPRGAAAWWRQMQTDPDGAADVERRIAEFFAAHVAPLAARGLGDPALDKFLAAVGGWADVGTRVRWPWVGAEESVVAPARVDARVLLPELVS